MHPSITRTHHSAGCLRNQRLRAENVRRRASTVQLGEPGTQGPRIISVEVRRSSGHRRPRPRPAHGRAGNHLASTSRRAQSPHPRQSGRRSLLLDCRERRRGTERLRHSPKLYEVSATPRQHPRHRHGLRWHRRSRTQRPTVRGRRFLQGQIDGALLGSPCKSKPHIRAGVPRSSAHFAEAGRPALLLVRLVPKSKLIARSCEPSECPRQLFKARFVRKTSDLICKLLLPLGHVIVRMSMEYATAEVSCLRRKSFNNPLSLFASKKLDEISSKARTGEGQPRNRLLNQFCNIAHASIVHVLRKW